LERAAAGWVASNITKLIPKLHKAGAFFEPGLLEMPTATPEGVQKKI
jgi:hypothetical protein